MFSVDADKLAAMGPPQRSDPPADQAGSLERPHFIGLHELFDNVNEEVEEYAHEIAERAVQLGGIASQNLPATSRIRLVKLVAKELQDHFSILLQETQPECDRLRARLRTLPLDDIATTIICFQEQPCRQAAAE